MLGYRSSHLASVIELARLLARVTGNSTSLDTKTIYKTSTRLKQSLRRYLLLGQYTKNKTKEKKTKQNKNCKRLLLLFVGHAR